MSSGNMEYYNGHLSDFKAAKIEMIIDKALEELQGNAAFFKVLGSYPVSLT